jgi:hypothetical protein
MDLQQQRVSLERQGANGKGFAASLTNVRNSPQVPLPFASFASFAAGPPIKERCKCCL